MVYISLVLLLAVHLLPWFRRSRFEKSPSKVFFLLSGITTIPYLLIIAIKPSLSPISTIISSEFDGVLIEVCLIYSIGMIAFLVGIGLASNVKAERFMPYPMLVAESKPGACITVSVLSCTAVVALTAFKLGRAGGISELWANIALRSELLAGAGFLDALIYPLGCLAVTFSIYAINFNRKSARITAAAVFLIVAVCFSAFGGRKNTLYLIVFAVLAAKIYNNRMSFFSPVFLLLYASGALFFFYVLVFRLEAQSGAAVELDLIGALSNLSYADTYIFITDYFSKNSYWYGSVFGDIPLRIFSSGSSEFLPPVDDGVYIRTLAEGITVRPPTAFGAMYPSSWPPESYGSGFANFGIFGVALFFSAKGFVCGILDRWARKYNFGPFSLVLLFSAILGFHISNLRIIQFGALVISMIIISTLLNGLRRITLKR